MPWGPKPPPLPPARDGNGNQRRGGARLCPAKAVAELSGGARKAAKILVYQMGDESMGVITDKEIREDVLAGRDVIVWFTGQFNDKGRPMFVPRGIELSSSVKTLTGTREVPPHPVVAAQLTEFQKAGTQLRAELWDFLKDRGNVTITGSSAETIEAVRDRLQVAA